MNFEWIIVVCLNLEAAVFYFTNKIITRSFKRNFHWLNCIEWKKNHLNTLFTLFEFSLFHFTFFFNTVIKSYYFQKM